MCRIKVMLHLWQTSFLDSIVETVVESGVETSLTSPQCVAATASNVSQQSEADANIANYITQCHAMGLVVLIR